MPLLKGKAASPGIALARAFVLKPEVISFSEAKNFNSELETTRWTKAHSAVVEEISQLQTRYQSSGPKESAQILEAHLMMAQDPEWIDSISALLSKNHQCEFAVFQASEEFAKMIEALNDPYLRQRAQDIRDVAKRVLTALSSSPSNDSGLEPQLKTNDYILVAEDLLPSELLANYSPHLKAIVLAKGNPTSHTTILARTFEVPLVLKVAEILESTRNGDWVAVNGVKGSLTINPTNAERLELEAQIQQDLDEKKELENYIQRTSVTTDGHAFEVASNLNSPMDLDFALRKGSEGVGLFRTEFLLMDRAQSPSEDEQYQVYRKVVEAVAPHRAVIRTFDIGGDKQVSYLKLPKEDNPFLGLRGIRYCLQEKDFFSVQIRALLRAAQHGQLGIMIPMLTQIDELIEFKELLNKELESLKASGIKINKMPEIGIMIEVPSAAMIVDQLAPHLDFISVGTNDLVQYLCAADRMNSSVADLHDSYHPAVLRVLQLISNQVKKSAKPIWMGMCGEMAAQKDYLPLLLALGFKELSVSPGAVLRTRKRILSIDMKECSLILEKALTANSSNEMKKILSQFT